MSDIHHLIDRVEQPRPGIVAWAGSLMAYFFLLLAVLGLSEAARGLASEVDWTIVAGTGSGTFSRLMGLGALPVLLFLMFQALVRWVRSRLVQQVQRSSLILVAAFLAYGFGMLVLPESAQSGLAVAVGGGLLITLLFDLFTEKEETGFGWTVLALLSFAAFTALVLWQEVVRREENRAGNAAVALAEPGDPAFAEPALTTFYEQLKADPVLPQLLKPWPIKPSSDSIQLHISKCLFEQKYLFHQYQPQVFAFDRGEESPLLLNQSANRGMVRSKWEAARPVEGKPFLRLGISEFGVQRYLLHISINRMLDEGHPVELYCFFDQEYPASSKVYAHLFAQSGYKGISELGKYNFAVSSDGRLVAEQGAVSQEAFQKQPDKGSLARLVSADQVEYIARSSDGQWTAVVGLPRPSMLKAVYLFSVLFTFSSLLLLVLGVLARWFPLSFTLLPSVKGSLGRRLHFSYLGLLAVGFLGIGWITFRHFTQTAELANQKAAAERAQAALAHVRVAAVSLSSDPDSVRSILGPRLAEFAQSLAIDANLLDAKGNLLYSTREDLRRIGQLQTQLNEATRFRIVENPTTFLSSEVSIAGQLVPVQYLAVLNGQRIPIAFLELPERALTDVRPELSDFIGKLASIYVFLLLLAAGATYVLSNSITGPIKSVSEKIKEVQLQDKNLPIQYAGDSGDEIGNLVQEYNRMVDKLEDSKEVLVKLEREAAWKEMARQIAHDIKNPLTTMKLTMQQLERVADDPDQAASYLKKATGRLIAQIDSLAQTASEFSMFANLDKTPRHPVNLNDLVENVYGLFRERGEADFSLELPQKQYLIRADHNHLLRVLNNLVLNAIQAIPSDRRGKVHVSLEERGPLAVVRIADNGGGIPIEIRERVFEPNFTTKTSGSGLGLAICKKIIEAHEGDIHFVTKDNIGTEFFVELPIIELG
ncbi:MAG: ATP-binding protein [Chitinophagales bacterium]|jgi:signal transduction histidine kinase